jgi:hypothetical protein
MQNQQIRDIKRSDPAYADLLRTAFALVQNPEDWKAPIDCIVPAEAAAFIYDAIVFVTGTVPYSTVGSDGRYHMKAIGYRNGPCGDH